MSWVTGVDVGGTFTDLYAFDPESGAVHLHKTPSTPGNPAEAVLGGLRTLAARSGLKLADLARFCHGTTVGTNALIQRSGGTVALVTTAGFRDLLEIGRQTRPHMYDFQIDNPAPLVPRHLRFAVAERITAGGRVIAPLDEDEIARVVAAVRRSGADACAICLLFAFVNPAHERRLRDALAAALPGLDISLSSEVQPEFREYERLSTTVLNAYLQPVMSTYLRDIAAGVRAMAPAAAIGISQSSGGLMSVERARRFPVRTALSGPAAGVVGAVDAARRAGFPDIVTLDMGGTSADVALIRDYMPGTSFDRDIEGFPTRLPSLDINAVGAGGGSIAWFERDGLLKVGPRSAGAVPGPACYGLGGTAATVTDANLVLGRLPESGLLGGGMRLDAAAARRAITPLAERLGFAVERTAQGILGIVVANMVRAIRAVSVVRGHDPRLFVLLPFGGAGPLHASDVARSLGIARVLVPPAPGILCAQGLIVSDLRESFVRTRPTPLDDRHDATLRALIDELRREAEAWFAAEGVAPARRVCRIVLDMRYVGQNFELAVDLGDTVALPDGAALRRLFFAEHERSYGFHTPDDAIEIVNYRLVAIGGLRQPAALAAPPRREAAARPTGRRPVWFAGAAAVDTPIYDRAQLLPGDRLTGPAVVEQMDATTLLFPGDLLAVDAACNLIVEVAR